MRKEGQSKAGFTWSPTIPVRNSLLELRWAKRLALCQTVIQVFKGLGVRISDIVPRANPLLYYEQVRHVLDGDRLPAVFEEAADDETAKVQRHQAYRALAKLLIGMFVHLIPCIRVVIIVLAVCACADAYGTVYIPYPCYSGERKRVILLLLEDCVRILYPGDEAAVGYKDGSASSESDSGDDDAHRGAAPVPKKAKRERAPSASPRKAPTCKKCGGPMKGHSKSDCGKGTK